MVCRLISRSLARDTLLAICQLGSNGKMNRRRRAGMAETRVRDDRPSGDFRTQDLTAVNAPSLTSR